MKGQAKSKDPFVRKMISVIKKNNDRMVLSVKEERPKIEEMSTIKPEDSLRKITI